MTEFEPRSVTLTFSGPEFERIQLEADDEGVSVDEWIQQAVDLRHATINSDLAHSIEKNVTVELPDSITQRAYLRYKQAQQSGHDNEFSDYVWDYLLLDPEFVDSDGEPVPDCDENDEE
jgi:hypothetical protein